MILTILTLSLCANAFDAQMLMGGMPFRSDIHEHHRCCQHDMWHGTLHLSRAMLPAGTTDPIVTMSYMHLDFDYMRMWERENITIHDVSMNTTTTMMKWKDYNQRMTYTLMENGTCMSKQMTAIDKMMAPCIRSEYMYGGRLNIGSGSEMIHAHSWYGMENGMQISYSVTENDCTPVTLNVIGDVNGTRFMEGGIWTDVKQGELSSMNPFHVPQACMKGMMSAVGK